MQRKNDDLKSKFEHLESAVGVFDDFGVDTEDMVMLNGIDKQKPAPRMFCDICKCCNIIFHSLIIFIYLNLIPLVKL